MTKSKTAPTTVRVVSGITKKKAKCAANQAAVDKLVTMRLERGPTDNYGFALKRATESLAASAEPVTTYQQALDLRYVGRHIAQMICPVRGGNNDNNDSLSAATSSTQRNSSSNNKKRPRKNTEKNSNCDDGSSVDSSPSSCAKVASKREKSATAKEAKLQDAILGAENYKNHPHQLQWRVLLLVDGRERKSEHIQAKCQMSGIPCEERHLPIGDMAWIAQGYDDSKQNRNKNTIVTELMLGTIVERKSIEDLKASLFGTRYAEQRLRLQNSGLPQILFLIEGNMKQELFKCPSETLHTAVWETRLHLGFSIVHTEHMEGTVKALKRMHRRILQRSFPTAFYEEALPTFAEVGAEGASSSGRQQQRDSLDGLPDQRRRRRRRRLQSLMEMTFDTDPVPPFGMQRFVTYPELKARIERDREAGTRTIGSIHAAMLKQVATVSSKKCQALTRAFPTPGLLLAAIDDALHAARTPSESNGTEAAVARTMISDLPVHDPSLKATAQTQRKMGPRSGAEICVAYGIGCDAISKSTAFSAASRKYETDDSFQHQPSYVEISSEALNGQRPVSLNNKNELLEIENKKRPSSTYEAEEACLLLSGNDDEVAVDSGGDDKNDEDQSNGFPRANALLAVAPLDLSLDLSEDASSNEEPSLHYHHERKGNAAQKAVASIVKPSEKKSTETPSKRKQPFMRNSLDSLLRSSDDEEESLFSQLESPKLKKSVPQSPEVIEID